MTTEVDLLNSIHENSDMGKDSLNHILQLATEPQFMEAVEKQRDEYEAAYQKSEEMLRARQVYQGKDAPAMGKVMSGTMMKLKNLADPSTSKLAEMVLKGNTMGITELTKKINDYHSEDKEVLNFAEKQLKQEERNAETMKKFL